MNWREIGEIATNMAAICAAVLFAVYVAMVYVPFVLRALGKIKSKSAKLMLGLMALSCTIYGGYKGRITYPRTDPEVWYLKDNGSYVSNDFVRVSFAKNLLVPNSANFFIDALELSYTNANDWAEYSFNVYSNTVGVALEPFDLYVANATNYNFVAYTDWTPPPVTHTNGVAYIVWQIGANKPANDLVTLRTAVYFNGARVAPNPAITNILTRSAALLSAEQEENDNER